jgi:GATA-binding protein
MATLTDTDGHVQPVCQNCTTSTTPLWRRDEIGSVLCNACGLFLKLHGRPRPISLKTDVIKSRNRVKSSGQGPKRKVAIASPCAPPSADMPWLQLQYDANGVATRSDAGTPPPKHPSHRRVSHKPSSGDSDRPHSPVSRTTTPAQHHPPNIAPQHLFDATPSDPTFHSPSLPALHLRHPSPGSTTSLNDRHLEPRLSYETMQQTNNSYKTRINELEVINNLFQDRVHQLEDNARNAERMQNQYRDALARSEERENLLKRRVADLEREASEPSEEGGISRKRSRLSEVSSYPEPAAPVPAST